MASTPVEDDAKHRVLKRLIGTIITEWATTEWMLAFIFSALVRCDLERARIILASQINFRAKRQLIERLGNSYLPEENLAEFRKIMAKVKHLSEKRNMIAHRRPYFVGRGTFRFFNDEDATQPNTFGHYADVQIGNLRTWHREVVELGQQLLRASIAYQRLQLLASARLWTPPSDDPRP